ncbi:hypothetical protein GCM10007315_04580 [Gemmobacter tilapiae]|uniref:Uncharacterized protein n=1 Tax=Neogemmobacter tilapiae TaxID=875041 RepID=A0A918WFC6_9RHOB|nr:hypothetical protein GCM10007315_04580 [Gemmobacter tilapiae]
MTEKSNPMDRLADFVKSGRNRTEPIPDDIKEDLGKWLDEENRKRRASYSDPMLPPWQYRPDIPRASMGWRMGPGEDYIMDFLNWYRALSVEQQQIYAKGHPEPNDWDGFLSSILPKAE